MGKYEEALERAKQGLPIDEVFPELKESEDERIIDNIKKAVELYWSDEPLDEILSWLEKQKEPRDYRKLYEEVVKSDWFKENYVGKSLGEDQQPAEWSEEDEQWLESIIKDYEDSLVKDKDHAAVIKIKIDFLKSLCPQPHWNPSEEQIQVFKQTLTNFIEDCIAENLENTTPENKDNHDGYHQACWDILYFIKQASK